MNKHRAVVGNILARYAKLSQATLLRDLPRQSPAYLYDLLADYPGRSAKGLRPALCLAICSAFGGEIRRALNSAVAAELFHNAFLIHDDIQDESEQRRGLPTLHTLHGVGIALNVGAATNLLGLQRIMANREILGSRLAWEIAAETEIMFRHSLEGQALELGWIHENACNLTDNDYYRMCLKKTSWYTCIYPCRIGALIAGQTAHNGSNLDQFAWYLGAAFQIQDDLLNLTGDYAVYGKEILGDLWEGKRTLMVIHLLQNLDGADATRLRTFLGLRREQRTDQQVRWVLDCMRRTGSLTHAERCARELADAAQLEIDKALYGTPESDDRNFLLAMPEYVITRDY
ncbi:polyprenyl synthetase family protein [Rhodococcus koreensis]